MRENRRSTAKLPSPSKATPLPTNNTSSVQPPFHLGPSGSKSLDMNEVLTMMERLLHWAAIIESSDDAIISKSIDGRITSWNKGAERLYGYTAEEIVGQPVSVLMPPEKKDDFPRIMEKLQRGERIDHYETKRMAKNGRVIDVSITVSPIRDQYGNIIGASKIARDVTERAQGERRRKAFMSVTSHELKTPVTSLKVFGELLERLIEQRGDEEYRLYVRKINAQVDKLSNLVEDLLELSRLETGRLKLNLQQFLMDELVGEIVDTMQLTTDHRILFTGAAKVQVVADRERIGQVLTNLLANATKYSPKRKKVLVSSAAGDRSVTVTVQDFGIGIDPRYHHQIFEQFFRVDNLDEATYPGMGIGLHLCREIVNRHGGKIWVESEKGKGATFSFTLPTESEISHASYKL